MTHFNASQTQMRAFALGYFHGRKTGVESNPFKPDDLRNLYQSGYDAGVSDSVDHANDDTYDEFGVNTRNTFNTEN